MIKLQCVCGHQLNLPDQLGGKKIRCKHCNKILKVPDAAGGTPARAMPTSDPLLHVLGSRPCPGCGKIYPPTVVVCVDCGVNVDSGAMLYASLEETPRPNFDQDGDEEDGDSPPFFRRVLRMLGFGRKEP